MPRPTGARVRVDDIMSVRETAGHLVDGLTRPRARLCRGAERLRSPLHLLHHPLRARQFALGRRPARWSSRCGGLAAAGLRRGGADRGRPDHLGRGPAGRADAWASWSARILKLVPELPRLRLSSIDAAEIDADLMRCLAEEPRLCPHLHLSLQSGDDLILKRMKRRHSRADALRLIAAVRARAARRRLRRRPDRRLSRPRPTRRSRTPWRWSRRPASPTCTSSPSAPAPARPPRACRQLPRPVVKARAERLRAAGAAALARHLDRQVGREIVALVERDGLARANLLDQQITFCIRRYSTNTSRSGTKLPPFRPRKPVFMSTVDAQSSTGSNFRVAWSSPDGLR